MAEQLSNLGYLALKKETTKGVPVTPNVFVPLYEDSMVTDVQIDEDTPIMGNKMDRYQALQGMRAHTGDVTILAEPNTLGYFLDMLYTKTSTTGSNPYTHVFSPSISTNPNSYTMDIQKGQVVHRFMGVEASAMEFDFDKNKMTAKVSLSGLKSFMVREIASVTTNVVTFKTNYDPTPTTGLVASDLVRIVKASDGSVQDFTVTSMTATTVTISGSPSGIVSGDLFYIRAQTPSYTIITPPFLWTQTEFRFAADATTALSATQTRMDDGTKYTLKHDFDDEKGSPRSGAFDPASLIRALADVEFTAKVFFDTPFDLNRYLTISKRACVIRHFCQGTTYELRTTLNNLKAMEDPVNMKTKEILYNEMKLGATWDATDGAGLSVTLVNAVTTY